MCAIFRGLSLCSPKADVYAVFKAVLSVAANRGVSPYNVDKLFWLVGSGNFYDHPSIGAKGRIPTNREQFVRQAQAVLVGATSPSLQQTLRSPLKSNR